MVRAERLLITTDMHVSGQYIWEVAGHMPVRESIGGVKKAWVYRDDKFAYMF